MVVEFQDGTQLEAIAVFGSPRLVDGVVRDTLRFEFDVNMYEMKDLKAIFKDNSKTNKLYTYDQDQNEEGDLVDVKTEMGEGYNLFVSISDEERKIVTPPGKILPDVYEEIYAVVIAQMTYKEYQGYLASATT